MAAETIKMCDMSVDIAAKVFVMLNQGKVRESDDGRNVILVTNTEPKDLIYPEGWYYAKGNFRNKHQSSTGLYEERRMCKKDGSSWEPYAKYCTLCD